MAENIALEVAVELARKWKLEQINKSFSRSLQLITKEYPRDERDGWETQKAEAIGYLADNSFPTPALNGILDDGGDMLELATLIIEKVTAYSTIYGVALSVKKKAILALNTTETVEEIYALS